MMAKPDDMKSLIGNLLDNAIQYSDHGGHVTINASKQGKRVVVEVRDDGIGINEDDLTKVFNRFWRSDKARTHNSGGSGLGLALVQAILNRYGGSIVIDSKIGSGTVVTITLPVVQRALLQQGAGIS
jgi:signal transduction histidine kinase